MNTKIVRPQLIAHRGYSQCYPENTLIALEAALKAGAQYVEFDVHFTADAVPVVFHDSELKRTTGAKGDIHKITVAELANLRAGEFDRFGNQFADEPVPTLQDVLVLLRQWPNAQAFVEIKCRTVECFGVEHVAQQMVKELTPHMNNCILISYHRHVLEAAHKAGMQRIGWVIREWGNHSRKQAEVLRPDVLFCDVEKIPDVDNILWPGPWQWALYDVVDAELALRWAARGVQFIETWDIGGMLRNPRLSQR
jgi:glycerophosphoryl diester phosphodiesterase